MEEDEIRSLADQTERVRYQFLQAETQTCFTSLEMAKFELSINNLTIARREVAAVEKGVKTLERFIPKLSGEQRAEIEESVQKLKDALRPVLEELSNHPE